MTADVDGTPEQMPDAQSDAAAEVRPQMFQRQLFPIAVITTYPNDQGSADLGMIGLAENGKDYAIKTVTDGNGMVPASEAFCYQLARHILIGTPDFDVIELHDGSLAFGSAWEGGVETLKDRTEILRVLSGEIPIVGLKAFFSKVYALDLFVNNVDRHFGNYIFRPSYSGKIGLAFDFSRAWFAFNPFGFEATEHCNTFTGIHAIRQFGQYDKFEAEKCLDKILSLTTGDIDTIISNFPAAWMSEHNRQEFLGWWDSQARKERIDFLKGML
ncbi:hypothetical protein BV326_01438 [Pseudomonas syringae pv. actinidiae]|uniref:hypothetical protein n=1 Tax=Pseudomonas syringae TaxID=317 RepID=UPI000A232CCF|nr:hypothetical protein [Pseudomonas syringae]OSR73982.1 hypothetical protein BV326_01438 [Pseudomonas syringae pv. actinidiae]